MKSVKTPLIAYDPLVEFEQLVQKQLSEQLSESVQMAIWTLVWWPIAGQLHENTKDNTP